MTTIYGLGLNYTTGKPIHQSLNDTKFGEKILYALRENAPEVQRALEEDSQISRLIPEIKQEIVNLADPLSAGWTFLINVQDPQRDSIIDALRPLAEHRGMLDPDAPLEFHDEPPDEWLEWRLNNCSIHVMERVPHYILIVGGPECVPFHFQSFLGCTTAVGRLAFDTISELETYVEKIIRLEHSSDPVVDHEAFFFGPEHPPTADDTVDATYFSRRYMAEPLSDYVEKELRFNVSKSFGAQATRNQWFDIVHKRKPALVYTAGHGLAAPHENEAIQRKFNGAICCLPDKGEPINQAAISADDVPVRGKPFLEGAVFFQFACFGYGTPAESDFAHWDIDTIKQNTTTDFVAALPKRLLAHPYGPIAYIGHVDTAWLHGFADPDQPHSVDRWHKRIEPFLFAVKKLLQVEPVGRAMQGMNRQFIYGNYQLTNAYNALQQGKQKLTPDLQKHIANEFIRRSDAQNYLVLGDPAAHLRIPA